MHRKPGQKLWVFRGQWGYWVHWILWLDSKAKKKLNWFWFNVFTSSGYRTLHCVELKDQEISQETKDRFEKLKTQYPEVFSLSSQDIGCTNLVTMHVDMGDSPPICQKPYTLPLKHYSWVQQEIKTLECVRSHQKEHEPLGQPNHHGTQEICTWWTAKT